MNKKQTLLIVDDNRNFVDRMICLIEEVSNIGAIHTAGDYDEARKLLSHEKPDVALLDINIPGKSGIELLKLVKKYNSECKVIMITNHADEYYRQQCYDLGAEYFLDKSNDFALVPGILSKSNLDENELV